MAAVMVLCFDIDGVLCNQVEGNYEAAEPNQPMIDLVNRLHDRGCKIVLSTSRFMGRTGGSIDEAYRIGYEFTRRQLATWGVRYHELHLGKPRYDLVVDDRSVFYDPDCARIEALIDARLRQRSVE